MSTFFPIIYVNCEEVKEKHEDAFYIANSPDELPLNTTLKIVVVNALLGTNTSDGDLDIIKRTVRVYKSLKG